MGFIGQNHFQVIVRKIVRMSVAFGTNQQNSQYLGILFPLFDTGSGGRKNLLHIF
jgi:hypothetical protein